MDRWVTPPKRLPHLTGVFHIHANKPFFTVIRKAEQLTNFSLDLGIYFWYLYAYPGLKDVEQ